MTEAEPVIRAALPDANVPTSIRVSGVPVQHGPTADLGAILETWLATHADGTACVIGAPAFEERERVRSLTPALSKGLEFDLVVLVDPERLRRGHRGGRRPLRRDDPRHAAARHPHEPLTLTLIAGAHRCGVLAPLPLTRRPAVWDSPRMSHVVVNAARPETREQRAWYWYDWANSAYVTTTATVLMSPYLTTVAEEAACPGPARRRRTARRTSRVLGIPVAPGSLWFFTVTFTTILSAIVLIFIGAIADRSPRPTRLLGGFAWAGALAASLMFFVAGTNWQLGAAARRRRRHLPRRVARHLRLDPVPHRQRERARPRLLEGLGVRLPRRRHPARAQLRPRLLPRGPRARPGPVDAHQHPVGRPLVGRLHRSSPTSGCAT